MEKKLTTDFYSNCLIFCVFTVIFIPNWTLFIRCCKMMVTGLSVNGAPHTVLNRDYNTISSVSRGLGPLTRSGMERNMFEARTDKKTAIFFADGCEEIEGLTVVDLLYRAGIPCTKVSINDQPEVTSSHEITFRTDTTVKELPFDEYDMLILPGGVPGTPNLRACGLLMNQVMDFCRNGKQIAAICAAPGIFAELFFPMTMSLSAAISSQAGLWALPFPSVLPSLPIIWERMQPEALGKMYCITNVLYHT